MCMVLCACRFSRSLTATSQPLAQQAVSCPCSVRSSHTGCRLTSTQTWPWGSQVRTWSACVGQQQQQQGRKGWQGCVRMSMPVHTSHWVPNKCLPESRVLSMLQVQHSQRTCVLTALHVPHCCCCCGLSWLLQLLVHLLDHTPRHQRQVATHRSHTNLDMNPSQVMRAHHPTRLVVCAILLERELQLLIDLNPGQQACLLRGQGADD